jgi:WD40 repeat protein
MRKPLLFVVTLAILCCAASPTFGQPDAVPPKVVCLAKGKGVLVYVTFSPDGKTLASAGDDYHIRLWDVATAKERFAFQAHPGKGSPSQLFYVPGRNLLAYNVPSGKGWNGITKLFDDGSGKEKGIIRGDNGAAVIAASPDGKFLAVREEGGKVQIYDLEKERIAHTVTKKTVVDSAAFSGDSKLLATAEGGAKVRLWDVA